MPRAEPAGRRLLPSWPGLRPGGLGAVGARRRALALAGMAALHVAVAWCLLHLEVWRDTVREVAPFFVSVLSDASVPPPSLPALPAPRPTTPPTLMAAPVPEVPLPAPAVATAVTVVAPSPEPSRPAVAAPALAPAPTAITAPRPTLPAPPPAPKLIPAEGVQFLEPPVVAYPRLSRRNAESGLVIVRAFVDSVGGAPRSVQISQSSGHARLDEAALAAVQKARFKPYIENGVAAEGWALVPIHFELEK
jgi:protein TonB